MIKESSAQSLWKSVNWTHEMDIYQCNHCYYCIFQYWSCYYQGVTDQCVISKCHHQHSLNRSACSVFTPHDHFGSTFKFVYFVIPTQSLLFQTFDLYCELHDASFGLPDSVKLFFLRKGAVSLI